jgi:hypothetical protein
MDGPMLPTTTTFKHWWILEALVEIFTFSVWIHFLQISYFNCKLLLIPIRVASSRLCKWHFLMCMSFRTMICLLMVSWVRALFFFLTPTSSFSWIFYRCKEIFKIHKFRKYVLEFSCWIAFFQRCKISSLTSTCQYSFLWTYCRTRAGILRAAQYCASCLWALSY